MKHEKKKKKSSEGKKFGLINRRTAVEEVEIMYLKAVV